VIPTKSDQPRQPSFDRSAYRARNQVERSVGRLKQFRRVATRYDERAVNYLAWTILAAVLMRVLRPLRGAPFGPVRPCRAGAR
jgi:transposase